MKAIWQRSFAAFAGPGIDRPAAMMRVSDEEAHARLAELAVFDWLPAVYTGSGRHLGYRVCNATNSWSTAIFYAEDIVGFYCGSYLWIARPHRKAGLSTPLILAAATQRGGSIMPPGVVHQGYTAEGVAVHRQAHRHAVQAALAAGLPVPAAVIKEARLDDDELASPRRVKVHPAAVEPGAGQPPAQSKIERPGR
ncbi:MAG: hypothetical protein ACM3X0_06650 [Bacteroidota bacterium]